MLPLKFALALMILLQPSTKPATQHQHPTRKVLFFSKSVEISVEKQFGGSEGDPTFAHLITSPGVWNSYASAYA